MKNSYASKAAANAPFCRILSAALTLICLCTLLISCTSNTNAQTDKPTASSQLFSVDYNGTGVALGQDFSTIASSLGEPSSRSEIGDCGGLGAQVKYTYNNMEIYTLKSAGKETVDQISLTSDLVSLKDGISLGATKDSVTSVYGTPNRTDANSISYTGTQSSGVEYVLKFKFSDNIAVAIDFIRLGA